MMFKETRRPQSSLTTYNDNNNKRTEDYPEAGCLYALITGRRPVSRRNRASWYLNQLNKIVECDSSDCLKDDQPPPLSPLDPDLVGSSELFHSSKGDNSVKNDEPATQSDETNIETDIRLISITSYQGDIPATTVPDSTPAPGCNQMIDRNPSPTSNDKQQYLVTPNTRVLYLSRSIATSILLDLSPSVVSVSSQNGCVFLDSMFDAIKRVLHLLVKEHEIPSTPKDNYLVLSPKVFVSVIAYTPFVVAKNNQVIIQNRRISSANIDQVLVELWLCLSRLTQEIHELVSSTCGLNLDYETSRPGGNIFIFPPHPKTIANSGIIRQPGAVLEDIFELGLFSSSLMPRLSRLSIIIISDGLFSSTNNLNTFRLKSIAVSFVSLSVESAYPDACFGYTPYIDLMKFVSKTTLGIYLSHQDLINSSYSLSRSKHIPFLSNPLGKLFCWSLHSEMLSENQFCDTPKAISTLTNFANNFPNIQDDPIEITPDHVTRYFCVDQALDNNLQTNGYTDRKNFISSDNSMVSSYNYHDWRSFRQLDRNLDADFEQVLACLLREGYLIKYIQFKQKESTRIVARLVLHWRHNLDLEQELSAPCWNNTNRFGINDSNHQLIPTLRPFNTPQYGDTYCEIIVHGSYSFLHNLYCDKRSNKRKSEFRDISYRQYRQLIDGVMQTQERLQYLSRFYRDSSLSKVPSFLLHGNSLLYEQPHTNRLTSTIENVSDESKTSDFQEYWQKISCLDTKSWKNLMHIHTLRLVLEHDQPKHKNIHYQNASGRYTHVQCRRALSAISNFIKSYSSFALLEDTTYIKFIYNKDDDLREIETSATKGFIVIRIHKLLPIVVIYLMFTSGILDSHRIKIVSYLEDELINCKLRNIRSSTVCQADNILKSKTIAPSGESCCVLLRSPLERMLKVYNRNYISDFLVHNLSHGLPGSCPYTIPSTNTNPQRGNAYDKHSSHHHGNTKTVDHNQSTGANYREPLEGYTPNSSINQYNLIFGKYLYGVRTVQTIGNLPHELLSSLSANVLSKISAILVNIRIKEGFHIAFNNSGILNLVVELAMKDHSNEDHSSSSLCQYIVFPPTVTSHPHQGAQHSSLSAVLSTSNNSNSVAGSKPGSLSGSLVNSDSYMRQAQTTSLAQESSLQNQQQQSISSVHIRSANNNKGEIKIIKEYWIEQQYGISTSSENYHQSLQNMRYSEVVDHLFITDSSIFECLLTYELLQLMCDKLSLYYELDLALTASEQKHSPLFSPVSNTTTNSSSNSSGCLDQQDMTSFGFFLPSTLIEGNTKDGNSKVPLLEMEYKFSLTKFLDYCQQASLNILMFKDRSEYGCSILIDDPDEQLDEGTIKQRQTTKRNSNSSRGETLIASSLGADGSVKYNRKTSFDTNDLELSGEHGKREHRSSYQHDNAYYTYTNPIYSPSLNHMFLETLYRRLKQMHDKELKLSNFDLEKLPGYLKRRKLSMQEDNEEAESDEEADLATKPINIINKNKETCYAEESPTRSNNINNCKIETETIEWRCFLRKGNQENLMIVLLPASLADVTRWLNYVNSTNDSIPGDRYDPVCPIFVFRCSSTMINDSVMSFLMEEGSELTETRSPLESDLSLHFGQPCRYMGELQATNDELSVEIMTSIGFNALNNQTTSDEKTLEAVHFRAFLRKIKNTVLKSRFSSLNDAYLSELFIHKDDILYYINNVDFDTQKKYHVSSQLKGLADFIKNYEEYSDSLPKEPVKQCNQLLNSILLQKCGLFINQPIARFDEANPLIKQLHDKKLLFLIRSNYKIELPILEENLAESTLLKNFVKLSGSSNNVATSTYGNYPVNNSSHSNETPSLLSTSLGKNANEGSRFMEMKCGSVGAQNPLMGSPSTSGMMSAERNQQPKFVNHQQQARFGSNTTINSLSTSINDSVFLEAFRGVRSCSINEVSLPILDENDIALKHEAHMAEVLLRRGDKKESHHYRKVLKSKGSYSQSHGAIDQALKRVDSLGRLEHFCLTPLLFSPEWRSKLAPVRDHTIEPSELEINAEHYEKTGTSMDPRIDVNLTQSSPEQNTLGTASGNSNAFLNTTTENDARTLQQEADERWHVMVCNNYIKEYEQYIQTLGFNSVQIRYQSSSAAAAAATSSQMNSNNATSNKPSNSNNSPVMNPTKPGLQQYLNSSGKVPGVNSLARGHSISASNSSLLNSNSNSITAAAAVTYNTGYLIKFLNSGCLVFKVGFCKPYVYSILYSIEGERFNNTNVKLNMTSFLDELDNIKVTMHLHSFTYDYHLRSMYSYISGRQLTFSPGYHLISFLDDFRKYYQKAPNYARNHILSGEINISDIKVTGQQLYNYIVTHNSTYNMEVLEMSNAMSNLISDISSKALVSSQHQEQGSANLDSSSLLQSEGQTETNVIRNHANDYVLIELKREKVRYRDGKDPDIFDCGLLITHDFQQSSQDSSKNNLTLKYFLLLTNQRDLYPKLIHTYDSVISSGFHRPIRLGLASQQQQPQPQQPQLQQLQQQTQDRLTLARVAKTGNKTTSTSQDKEASREKQNVVASGSDLEEAQSSGELQSSSELSGPTSILSTNSASSGSSGLQFGAPTEINKTTSSTSIDKEAAGTSITPTGTTTTITTVIDKTIPKIKVACEPMEARQQGAPSAFRAGDERPNCSSVEGEGCLESHLEGSESPSLSVKSQHHRQRNNSTGSGRSKKNQERTICDEEITYLGYFSSDEMDVLKFLQQKTNNLRSHIEQVVKRAEVHYRRDYLWHKLMQRTGASAKCDDILLSIEELVQLLSIVEAIDLAVLDSQLSIFTSMHVNWYLKLIKAFGDVKQSSTNQHRIYSVKASKLLLLYIDPNCTTAFILLSIDQERGSVEMNMLLKDKQECSRISTPKATASTASSPMGNSVIIDLDQDCQQLINDFINFCAAFMWSTFLN